MNISFMFTFIFKFLICYIVGILFHEIGHIGYFQFKKNKEVNLDFRNGHFIVGKPEDYVDLSRKETIDVNLVGIVLGFSAITLFTFLEGGIYALVIIPYLAGCKKDFKNIIKEYRNR